ncbi:uncharacterized protein BDW70DRAFT_139995 [Aspergillus foveolatus]|uniref:uncharacterized protein n=1 Tax=Aspergillus foveolatus TaxID=210207 RepID=UPI003CCDF029
MKDEKQETRQCRPVDIQTGPVGSRRPMGAHAWRVCCLLAHYWRFHAAATANLGSRGESHMLLVAVGMALFSAYDLSSERLADRRASSFLDFYSQALKG